MHHLKISLRSGDGDGNCHMSVAEGVPFQTSVFDHSFPWRSQNVVGIPVTCLQLSKAQELSLSSLSSLLVESLRRGRDFQRVEGTQTFDRSEMNCLLVLPVPLLQLLRNPDKQFEQNLQILGNLSEMNPILCITLIYLLAFTYKIFACKKHFHVKRSQLG